MGIGDEVQQRPIEARAIAEHARARTTRDAQLDSLVSAFSKRADRRHGGLGELGRVELAKLESDRPGSIAREVEDLADEVLHPLGVSLHRLEHRATLLGCRVGRRVEQQARQRAHHRDRCPQLVRDDGQEVGTHPLKVLHGHGGISPGTVLDQAPPETREDILSSGCSSSDPNKTQRFKFAQQILDDARSKVGAILGESTLEIGNRCPALHQRECGNSQGRTPSTGRRHVAEHTTRYSTESTVTTRGPAGAMTSTVSPGVQPMTAAPSGESAEIQPWTGSPSPGKTNA